MDKITFKLWSREGKTIGTVKVDKDYRPHIIMVNGNPFTYNITYSVYMEADVYKVPEEDTELL